MKVHYLLIGLFLIGILVISGCAKAPLEQPLEGAEFEPSEAEEIEERVEKTTVSGKCDCDAMSNALYNKFGNIAEMQELQGLIEMCNNPWDTGGGEYEKGLCYGMLAIAMYEYEIWMDACICKDMLTSKARDYCYAHTSSNIYSPGSQDWKTLCDKIQDTEIKADCISAFSR